MEEKKKILLVGDDLKNIFALKLTLRSRGFACVCAQDTREAVSRLRSGEKESGLLLMDMMMPEMDGYEAMTRIKEDKQISDIPIAADDVDRLLRVVHEHFNTSTD